MAQVSVWPAIWSAIAATFSAITAFFTLRLHLINQRDSVRPELIVEEFKLHKRIYTPDSKPTLGAVTFPLKNVGRGPAFNTRISGQLVSYGEDEQDRRANAIGRLRPLIPSGEESASENLVEFFWPRDDDFQFQVEVHLHYFDSHGRLYQTTYRFEIISTSELERSVSGHIIDVKTRKTRRVPARSVRRSLSGTMPSNVTYAPVPMAYFFDKATEELAKEKSVQHDASEAAPSQTESVEANHAATKRAES